MLIASFPLRKRMISKQKDVLPCRCQDYKTTPKLTTPFFKNVNLLSPNSFSLQHPLGRKKQKGEKIRQLTKKCDYSIFPFVLAQKAKHIHFRQVIASAVSIISQKPHSSTTGKSFKMVAIRIKIILLIF